jgi:hypothetical protein
MLHPARVPRRHQLVRLTLAVRLKLSITQSCNLGNLYLPDLSWRLTDLGDNDYQTVDIGPSQLLHKSQGFLDPLSSNLFYQEVSGCMWDSLLHITRGL